MRILHIVYFDEKTENFSIFGGYLRIWEDLGRINHYSPSNFSKE